MFFEPNKVRVELKITKKYAVLIFSLLPLVSLGWTQLMRIHLLLLLYDRYELGNYLLMRLS